MKLIRTALLAAGILVALAAPAAAQSGCSQIINGAVLTAAQWNQCFQNKQDANTPSAPLTVPQGGTGLSAGTPGGVPYYPTTTTMASSPALGANQLVIGGGTSGPAGLGTTGTSTTLLHGNASGAPSFGPVNLATDTTGTAPTSGIPTGKSVADPGTGHLENLLPPQISTAASYTYATVDLQLETRRSHSGSAMTDTFPASTVTGLANGARITVNNVDATATDTITAGAGTTINGNSTDVIEAGRSVTYIYDLVATTWRKTLNTGSAAIFGSTSGNTVGDVVTMRSTAGGVQDSGVAIGTMVIGPSSAVSGNLPSFNGTGGKTIQDSGVAASNVTTLTGSQNVTGQKTFTAPILGAATGTSLALGGATIGSNALAITGNSAIGGTETVTSASASAVAVGPNGATNPSLKVDASTASAATGILVKSAAAGSGAAVSTVSSGTNENLTLDAKGSGSITVGGTSTGGVVLGGGVTAAGVATTGTTGGSLCRTAAGVVIYTSGANCFAGAGITIGSTTVTSGTSGYFLYNNAGTVGNLSPLSTASSPFVATATRVTGLSAGASSSVTASTPANTGGQYCVFESGGVGSSAHCGTYDNSANFVGVGNNSVAQSSGSTNITGISPGSSGAGTIVISTGSLTSSNNFTVTYWPSPR
jgi:hypothetical protein